MSVEAEENGREVLRLVDEAVALPLQEAVARLSLLVYLFDRVVLRVVSFHQS